MTKFERQLSILTDYFRRGETPRSDYMLGAEFENFIVHKDTFETVSYYEDGGIEDTIRHFLDEGYEGYYEKGHLIAAGKADYSLTTEPGGQFEMSLGPKKTLSEIDDAYTKFFSPLCAYLKNKDQRILNMGYHPVTKIDDIKLLPKARYDNMFDYFKSRGSLAHNMMKGTCALQLSIGYSDESDFVRKMRTVMATSNILYAFFDSAYFFEGAPGVFHCARAKIWENCDSDRSGLFPGTFDENFSYRAYAEYILNKPAIFAYVDGKLEYTKDRLIRDLLDPDCYTETELEHLLTMFFFDARLKHYIEIRMIDCIPYPLNIGALAMLVGIFYNDDVLDELEKWYSDLTDEEIMRSRHEMYEKGLDATLMGSSLRELSKWLYDLAYTGLDECDRFFLKSLEPMIESGKSLFDIIGINYKKSGIDALEFALYKGECCREKRKESK